MTIVLVCGGRDYRDAERGNPYNQPFPLGHGMNTLLQ